MLSYEAWTDDEQRYAIISPYFYGRIKMNGPYPEITNISFLAKLFFKTFISLKHLSYYRTVGLQLRPLSKHIHILRKLKFKIVSLNPAHGEVYLIQHYFNHRRPRTFKWLNSTKFFFGLPLNKMVKNIIKWAENQVLLFKDHEDSKLFQSIKII